MGWKEQEKLNFYPLQVQTRVNNPTFEFRKSSDS